MNNRAGWVPSPPEGVRESLLLAVYEAVPPDANHRQASLRAAAVLEERQRWASQEAQEWAGSQLRKRSNNLEAEITIYGLPNLGLT